MIFWGDHHNAANKTRKNLTILHRRKSDKVLLHRATLCANKRQTWYPARAPVHRVISTKCRRILAVSRVNTYPRRTTQLTPGSGQKLMMHVDWCHISSNPSAKWISMVILEMRVSRLVEIVVGASPGLLLPIRLIPIQP